MKGGHTDESIKEATLRVFQYIDAPTQPSSKGMRYFLNHISDEQVAKHRQQLIGDSKDDLVRVSQQYLHQPSKFGVTIIHHWSSE